MTAAAARHAKPRAARSPSERPKAAPASPITLTAAMRDPKLLGGPFQAPSFWPWFAVAKLLDGEKLDRREAELFRKCTGRSRLPTGPVRRLILLAGRRAGKDRFLSAVAIHRAALAADWRSIMSVGEQAVVSLLGADKKQAGILRRYCEGLLQAPLLAQEVARWSDDVVEFRNGAVLEVSTNDARLVRGRSAVAILGSECCHWRSDETSALNSDEEVVAAASPSLAMCPDGGLLLLGSSVYRRRGYMHRRWRELHGNDAADDICWLAPSVTMNPVLPAKVIERALSDDLQRAQAEYLSLWRSDLQAFVDKEAIESCVMVGCRERPPLPGVVYHAFCDPAGGSGTDAMTLAIGHVERGGRVVVDLIREVMPKFSPAAVVAEFADALKRYRITRIHGDRWGNEFVQEPFRLRGIVYQVADAPKSDLYRDALPMINSGLAALLDHPKMVAQFCALERRVARSGKDSIDHPPGSAFHDDICNAVAGLLVTAASGRRPLGVSNTAFASMMKWSTRPQPRSTPAFFGGRYGNGNMPGW
jgi:hypothetical protein